MLGAILLRASRSHRLRRAIEANRLSRKVVERFVPGESPAAAIATATQLHADGMTTSLDVLGENVTSLANARDIRDQYIELLSRLRDSGQASASEVSLKLSAVGQSLPGNGHDVALTHAREICAAADDVGCRVTLDMEDHTTVDSTLAIGAELRVDFPTVGNVLQANLRRTPSDIESLARSKARVRMVKGAYREPKQVAFERKVEVDRAYKEALRALMQSDCYPMVATHDADMIRAAKDLAARYGRSSAEWETQMLFGIGRSLQRELVASGRQVRIYIPFGSDWYGYFMRRLAERPANVGFLLRALVKR